MAENVTEVVAGAAVLAVALGFLVYAGQHTGYATTDSGSYSLKASFRSVEGVKVGTDVRLAGVKVGSITDLTLEPDTFLAKATLAINDTIHLPDDSAILISSEGLLGGNFVELSPGGSIDNFEPGDEIEDTQGAVSLISLLMKFVSSGSDSKDGKPADAPAP